MLVCLDQRTGAGCGAVNHDNAQFCKQCGRALRFALQLHNPGEVIGAYCIVRVIGHGDFGAVYEARETAPSARTIALKETFDPDQIESYQAEFTPRTTAMRRTGLSAPQHQAGQHPSDSGGIDQAGGLRAGEANRRRTGWSRW